jgi:hypothetical protein
MRLSDSSLLNGVVLPEIYPGPLWDGTPDGPSGSWNIPVATIRGEGIPQPWLNELFPPYQTIDGDWVFGFQSGARDHVEKVVAYCVGRTAESTTKSWHTYTDSNGVSRKTFGYHFKFKHAEAMAMFATGACNIWVRAIPVNKAQFADRVMGPYPVHPRATKYTADLQVGPGRTYSTLKDALIKASEDYDTANYRVMIMTSGDYKIDSLPSAKTRTNTNRWTTITTAPGVTATIGDSTGNTIAANGSVLPYMRPGLNHLHFQGAGVRFELCKMSSQMGGYYFVESGGGGYVWLDGIEITQGAPLGGTFRSGSGAFALQDGKEGGQLFANIAANLNSPHIYFTEVDMHDISATGMGYATLVRHSKIARSSGSLLQSQGSRLVASKDTQNWCVHGLDVEVMGGYDPEIGLALYNPGLTWEYEGSAAYVYFEKFNTNGNNQVPLEVIGATSGHNTLPPLVDGVQGNTWFEQSLTGGTGAGLLANITVVGGVVTAVACFGANWGDSGYVPGDMVTWAGAGGGPVTIRVCGNLRTWEGATPATAVLTNEYIMPRVQSLQMLTNIINATWPNWNVVNNEVDRKFRTNYLSVKDPAVAISNGIPKRLVTGAPRKLVMYCRMDIHSNVMAFPAVKAVNGSIFGLNAHNILGGSPISSSGGWEDVGIESSTWNDVTDKLDPALGVNISPEPGYWSGAQSHTVVRYSTFVNCGINGSGAREFCLMEQVYMASIGAQLAGVGQEIKSCVFFKAPLPHAADLDCSLLGAATWEESDVFTNPVHPNNNLIPKDLGSGRYLAQTYSGKVAGFYDIDGLPQYVGWVDPDKVLPTSTQIDAVLGQHGEYPIDLTAIASAIPDGAVTIMVPSGIPFSLTTSDGEVAPGVYQITKEELLTLKGTTVAADLGFSGPIQIRWRRNSDGSGPVDSALVTFEVQFGVFDTPLRTIIIKAGGTFVKPADFVTLDAIELWGPGGDGGLATPGVSTVGSTSATSGASGAPGGYSRITETTLPDADWTTLTLEVGAGGTSNPTRVLLAGVEKARANAGGSAIGNTGGVAAAAGVGELVWGGQQGEPAIVTTILSVGGAAAAGATSKDGVGKRGGIGKTNGRTGASGGGVGGPLSDVGKNGNGFNGTGSTGGPGPTGVAAGAAGTGTLPPTASTDGAGASAAGSLASHAGVSGLPGKILIATSTVDGENAYIAGGMAGGGAAGTAGQWVAAGGSAPDDCYGAAGSGSGALGGSPAPAKGLGRQGVIIFRYYNEAV